MLEGLISQDERAFLEFCGGLRYVSGSWSRDLLAAYQRGAAVFGEAEGRPPESLDDAHAILDHQPLMQAYMRVQRSSQEMNWRESAESAARQAERLEAGMRAAEERAPGRLVLNPAQQYPAYFWNTDFHLQPGGNARSPLAGLINYLGVEANQKGITGMPAAFNKKAIVDLAPAPPDGVVRRVMDLGCAVGWTTWPLKQRFPDAEVWGVDLSAPLLRFANMLAVDQAIDVRFAQMAAEAMTFPDDSFDLIHAHIVFHELPSSVAEAVLREALRVLRPGGVFSVSDFRRASSPTPFEQYRSEWSYRDNPEPFAADFVASDLPAAFRSAGFVDVAEVPALNMAMRCGAKPRPPR